MDVDQLREFYLMVYEKGLQNGMLIEAGVGVDRSNEEFALFIAQQLDVKKDRVRKGTIKIDTSVSIDERKRKFGMELEQFLGEYTRDQLREFFNYWTSKNIGEDLMFFEKGKGGKFNPQMRLANFRFKNKNINTSTDGKSKSDRKNEALRDYINS